jgi:nitrite reductase/ring-hydroxylating ferredoxin subunit
MPIGSTTSLAGLGPTRVEVLGTKLVVWQPRETDPKVWSVMADACVHRLAPLSQGRVNPASGCLECPYHGWNYNAAGECTVIPQLDLLKPIPRAAVVPSLHTRITGDVLWAFFEDAALLGNELLPFEAFPDVRYPVLKTAAGTYSRELPYSFDFLVENFMDPAHIPYAHHSLQSVRSDGSPIHMTVRANNDTHLEVAFRDVVRGAARNGVVSFSRPCFYHFRTEQTGHPDKLGLFMLTVPVAPGKSRVLIVRPKLPLPLPLWLLHSLSSRFVDTDVWLHDIEMFGRAGIPLRSTPALAPQRFLPVATPGDASPKTAAPLPYFTPTNSDLAVLEWRKWAHRMSGLFGATPASRLLWKPRGRQLDRYA